MKDHLSEEEKAVNDYREKLFTQNKIGKIIVATIAAINIIMEFIFFLQLMPDFRHGQLYP